MSTPDGRFWIVFNGEIYNYVELRRSLEQAGEVFQSTSDTEILLRLLACQGPQALTRLNGMFALVLVDTQARTFLLARDRLGVKPLYYQVRRGELRFASELKALLAWPDANRELNLAALIEYLAQNYLSNEQCIFSGYCRLPPAHYLAGSIDAPERAQAACYWRLHINGEAGGVSLTDHQVGELADLLTDAVRIRLRADVPVGIFLSGGLDSGLVASLAGQAAEGVKPLALTVGFAESDFDEVALARATAEQAGLEHRVIPQRQGGLADIDRLAWFYDEPFGDVSALPTFTLCEAASRHATVFIAGDGGDEAFGGYERYIGAQRYKHLASIPPLAGRAMQIAVRALPTLALLRYRFLKASLPDSGFAAAFDSIPTDPVIEFLLPADLKPMARIAGQHFWLRWSASHGQCLLARQQTLDYGLYLPDDILVKVDRASMAHSIEVRSPFLDYRVVEWAARLPRATLVNAREGKLPLRALGRTLLSPRIRQGVKRGFGVPLDEWFRQPQGTSFAWERLLSPEARQRGWWDPKSVEHLIAVHSTGQGRHWGHIFWRLLFLDAWARQYVDGGFIHGEPRVAVAA